MIMIWSGGGGHSFASNFLMLFFRFYIFYDTPIKSYLKFCIITTLRRSTVSGINRVAETDSPMPQRRFTPFVCFVLQCCAKFWPCKNIQRKRSIYRWLQVWNCSHNLHVLVFCNVLFLYIWIRTFHGIQSEALARLWRANPQLNRPMLPILFIFKIRTSYTMFNYHYFTNKLRT